MKVLTLFLGIPILYIVIPYLVNIVTQYPGQVIHQNGVVLVTGASSGIGLSAAVALKKKGYFVIGGVRKEKDAVTLRKTYGLQTVILDVTKEVDIERSKQEIQQICEEKSLPFVGLVNNAGVSRDLPVELQPRETIRFVYSVNTFGVMDMTREYLPLLRKSKGRIINIGSVAGLTALPGAATYHGTKHALEAISDCVRREMYPHQVSVSIVEPAYVTSKIFGKSMNENDPSSKLTQEEFGLYRHVFGGRAEHMKKAIASASPTTVTDEAITHAMTSAYPQTRYIVANVVGIPAKIIVPIFNYMPDRVADVVLYLRTKKLPIFLLIGLAYSGIFLCLWMVYNFLKSLDRHLYF